MANNHFENLDFLNSLPNKDKLQSLNLFGNQIQEIDFAKLFTDFPNLKRINISKNPASAKNLNNLTSEQFSKIIEGIKTKQIQLNCWKGTVLMDLLVHAKELVGRGNTNQQTQAHMSYLQEIVSQPQKTEVKEKTTDNNQISPKNSHVNTYLLVGGLILFGLAVLGIGYWLGKRKNATKNFLAK
ncbi:leucine-rich repeat domain-containing protein [endosymbiont GvMRE of Glomus versiforme]|uniref:leucine-rich repeat domain-containing protein n=1 Tax=endosymbiont GvMRE of Glomus versiforme TaxID=2039283 RepID=UPI001558F329|nr:leucine-rich repeat domain-containing protein [endosymbiont GvMRE of Glomus versiforme]